MLRDRVKELRRVRAADILPNPANWRTHPKAQQDAMRGILAEIGIADALLVRETPAGLQLIDGHLRADVAPDSEWPVLVLDVDDWEAAKLLATVDPLAAMAETDEQKLAALLAQVESAAREHLSRQLAFDPQAGHTYHDDIPEPPSEKQAITKPGDLWVVGRHRLLCGDSGDFDARKRVLAGVTPGVAVLDPPFEESTLWVQHIMDPCIVFGQGIHIRAIPQSLWRFERVIDKVTSHRGATTQICSRHAIVAQCGSDRVCPKNKRLSFDSIVVHEERQNHPHEKPVKLLLEHLTHFTPPWDVVFDPYAGSGSTFVAAEHMQRACCGIELSPAYCDVIVKRLESLGLSGQRAGSESFAPSRRPKLSRAR